MRSFLIAAALVAAPAAMAQSATLAPVTFTPEFQKTLEEDYGVKEGETLAAEVRQQLERALKRQGGGLSETAPLKISVTIEDAKPNKPTFKQLGDKTGLSYALSFGIGGASLKATILDASGKPLRDVAYSWYSFDIRDAQISSTWSDADRVIRRFSTEVAEAAAEAQAKPAG
jgi:hypothetical protein